MYVVDGPDDKVRINWDLAHECDEETTAIYPTGALYLFGKRMTVDEVLEDIGASVPLDFAEQVRVAAKRCGLTVSAFIMQALAEKLANV